MMKQFPNLEEPISAYELSQLESLARDFEQEGRVQEAIFLRNIIRNLWKLRDNIALAMLRQ